MENKKVGKMPEATNPGFHYHETIRKSLAASLLLKGLHIIFCLSQIKKCENNYTRAPQIYNIFNIQH